MQNAPLRMCIACRQMKDKRELIRIVKSAEEIKLDPTFKAAGRGAYVCHSEECLKKLTKAKLLNRAFKCEVQPEVYKQIEEAANEQR